MLAGQWTYRSYRNDPSLVGDDADKALSLIFGEGVMRFTPSGSAAFEGQLDMGGGYLMNLIGEISGEAGAPPGEILIVGTVVDGSPTAGWRYDYRCRPAFLWPDGVDQVPSLVGTVLRVKPHGPQSPAGVTASFIAVSHGDG